MLNFWKRGILWLLVGAMMMSIVSCKDSSTDERTTTESVGAGADMSSIPDIPTDIVPDSTETQDRGPVPTVPTTEGSMNITSAELLELIRSGNIAQDGDYTVTDGEGIVFDRKDHQKTYDFKNAIIRIGVRANDYAFSVKSKEVKLQNARIAVYGGTAVGVVSENSTATISEFHVSGNAEAAF